MLARALDRLGRLTARRRVVVLVAWALLVALGVVLGGAVFDRTQDVDGAPAGTASALAAERLDELSPEGEVVIAVLGGRDYFSASLIDQASGVMAEIREIPGVVEVTDAYTAGGLIADDGQGSFVAVELDQELDDDAALAVAQEVSDALHTIDTPEVLVGGALLAQEAFVDQAVTDAARGESVALVVLLVLLVVVLGGLRAGALPVLSALATIAAALLLLSGLTSAVPVNEFAVNVVTILGLGLAVDYSLLVLARFREERERTPDESIETVMGRTVDGAGRAVLTSGLAVGISLGGLFLLGDPLLSGMAVGGVVVVLVATIAGLTLVPALVAVGHRHVPAPGARTWVRRWTRRPGTGLLGRLARVAQRRAVLVTLGACALLVALAVPLGSLTLGDSEVRSLPATSEARLASEAATSRFSDLGVEPVTVLVDAPVQDQAVQDYLDEVAALPGVTDAMQDVDLPPEVTAVDLTPPGDATGADAQQLVRDVRSVDTRGLSVLVGGPAAELVDTQEHMVERAPLALGAVVLATFVLLFLLTGSVVVPVKALVLNLLTLAATLGVLVVVFQHGAGAGLLGFEPWGALDVTTPLLLGMLVFGLSMDYEVFLLSRMAEEWRRRDRAEDARVANDRAVLRGITSSGPVVTLAAVAIGIVFLGFAAGELVAMKEVGIGLAVAVLLDVTVVRGLLLPSTMTLLGRWNWWPGTTRDRARDREHPVAVEPELVPPR
ncbi:MMPL family transporter [Cellulosimicrobium arenosum]|uniref:MMPL family transporter n=1 Tax=Cellulosimicrobium arenosum TaxID=2708133 RepID=A0A927G7P3_9MICO|nr:MMPL family transporter [Cellulosimicrobium arenosum]MBD8078434.1 MMPL family transporter [Cellulosimicrobium arenosum]